MEMRLTNIVIFNYTAMAIYTKENFISRRGAQTGITGKSVQLRCGPAAVMLRTSHYATGSPGRRDGR